MGRPAHLPDPSQRRQVEAMAGYGVPEADIARVLGIDPKTLRKHYRKELDTGHIIANARVAESLFRKLVCPGGRLRHQQCVTPLTPNKTAPGLFRADQPACRFLRRWLP